MGKKFDNQATEAFKAIMGMVAICCMLFWWLPLLVAIGSLFRGEIKDTFMAFLLTSLMIILWKGGESVIDAKNEGNDNE